MSSHCSCGYDAFVCVVRTRSTSPDPFLCSSVVKYSKDGNVLAVQERARARSRSIGVDVS